MYKLAEKILLVEDEENIRKFTKINLEREGYRVIEAGTGEDGIVIAEEEKPDIAILDVMLPGINGFEVCTYLRENMDIGIIMLTAKTQDDDKIKGFEQGADDYLSKPFNPKELILRIKSLSRRLQAEKPKENQNVLEIGPFKLDLYSKIFTKEDKEIILTPNELSMTTLFMKNPGKAFTRQELLDIVWGEGYAGDNKIVDVNIRRLRSKVEDNPSKPTYLETVWGTGYRWKTD